MLRRNSTLSRHIANRINSFGRKNRFNVQLLEDRTVPATITVTNAGDNTTVDGLVTLREAINSINGGANLNADVVAVGAYGTADTILFDASFGVSNTITLAGGTFVLTKAMTITGPGSGLLEIKNTTAATRVMQINVASAAFTISGVKISGGTVTTGGGAGILISSASDTITLSDVVLTGNTSNAGGAIYSLVATNLTINNKSVLSSNSSTTHGGAVFFNTNCTLTFDDATVQNNTASSIGGGFRLQGSTGKLTINNSTLSGNKASASFGGGAGYTNAPATLSNSTITANLSTTTGGGFYNFGGATTVTNCLISSNTASGGSGGGLRGTSAVVWTIGNSTITNNSASSTGGGIQSTANMTINNSTISNNKSGTTGAGINASSSSVTVNSSVITGNSATTTGGGINIAGATLNVNSSTIDGNNAVTSGGGINCSSGTVNVAAPLGSAGSTISNNSSALGGGLHLSTTGTVTIRNSTIAKNTATGTGGGGGISLQGSILNLQNTTVAINATTGAGSLGGGFRRTSGTLNLSSSIIAGNTDIGGSADGHSTVAVSVALGDSLIGSDVAGDNITYTGTGQTNVAAGLDPAGLQLNGAPSGTPLTIGLVGGSLAINKGNNLQGLTTDARGAGFPRAQGISADVGAFESPDPAPTAAGSSPNVTTAGGVSQTVTVVYTDLNGSQLIDFTTVGVGTDITVNGPGGFTTNPTFVSATPSGVDAKTITATYSFTPPGGYWNFPDNGAYTITMNANEVLDKDGTANPVPAGTIGTFTVTTPTNIPAAAGSATNVTVAGGTSHNVTVKYTDDIAIDVATLDSLDVTINGPGGFTTPGTFVSVDVNTNGTPRTGTYSFTPPGGAWDGADNGSYTITMNATQVFDADTPTPNAVPANANIGTFAVGVPFSFVVDATNDEATDSDGKTSLREAILAANGKTGTIDNITFDPMVFSGATTITLTVGTEMAINEGVNITGPAVALTVDAGAKSRIFNTSAGAALATVSISNMTLTNGKVTAASGGAILVGDEAVTLTSVTISNSQGDNGGGIQVSGTGKLNLLKCVVTGNKALGTGDYNGGGIDLRGAATVTVDQSTISGNSANGDGGGFYFNSGGSLNMTNSTVSGNVGNVTTTGAGGGGLYFFSTVVVISNSTISGNTAKGNGGGVGSFSTINTTIKNSTIAFNSTTGNGGGVSGTGTVLTSTIVSNNSATGTGPDTNSAVTANFSLLGNTTGAGTITGANNQLNVAANLAALNNYGGPTKTHGLLPGSAALDNGSNPDTLAFDQRGTGFNRVVGANPDIGAFEGVLAIPGGALTPLGPITVVGVTPDTVDVVYTDDTGIDVSTIDINDITITGPGGPVTLLSVSVNPSGNGTPRTATYKFAIPGGGWDGADNGTYSVDLKAGQVFDTDSPTPNSNFGSNLGSFKVLIPITYVVDEATDVDDGMTGVGKLSIREAIKAANTDGTTSFITFDGTVFAGATTITMATPTEMAINDAVTITGPAAALTIDAVALSRIFNTSAAAAASAIAISNMTLTNGKTTGAGVDGGALLIGDESVTLSKVTVSNSVADSGDGGGISIGTGTLNLTDCVITGNQANGATEGSSTAGSNGGGINVDSTATVNLQRSTVSNNSSTGDGGGFYFFSGGTFNVDNSTISGNSANTTLAGVGGGAVYLFGTTTTIRNSTISGNSTKTGAGGGIGIFSGSTVKVNNSTLAFNSAPTGGGISGATTLISTIVAKNSGTAPDISGAVTVTTSLIGDVTGATVTGTPVTGDPNLQPLANNGGPTQTHALVAGSIALDVGSNPDGQAFDQRGIGFNRVSPGGGTADIGAFELQAKAAKVTGVSINSNPLFTAAEKAQRSRVLDVAITFDSPVTFVGAASAAFTLDRVGGGAVTFNATVSGGGTVVTLDNFGGTADFGSLADGRYALHAVAAQFAGAGLDGDGNGTGGDDFLFDEPAAPAPLDTAKVFRIFGDFDGDGTVAAADFIQFRLALGGTGLIFDYDNDGSVAASDFIQFRLRFGGSI